MCVRGKKPVIPVTYIKIIPINSQKLNIYNSSQTRHNSSQLVTTI